MIIKGHDLPGMLRAVIAESGQSQNKIAKGAGVPQQCVNRFCRGGDITATTAGKLLAYFSVELEFTIGSKP